MALSVLLCFFPFKDYSSTLPPFLNHTIYYIEILSYYFVSLPSWFWIDYNEPLCCADRPVVSVMPTFPRCFVACVNVCFIDRLSESGCFKVCCSHYVSPRSFLQY